MTVVDLAEELEDSNALHAIAKRANITLAQARIVAVGFAELPMEQTIRICVTAQMRAKPLSTSRPR